MARLTLASAATLVAVFLLEIGLRLAGVSYPSFHTWDEHRGTALRPGAQGWWREEGEAYVRINRDGMRDREHPRAKPPNAFRVAILGDSFAAALQVPLETTFWSVLERELGGCPDLAGRQVEVLNFGVSGYGTDQELLTLRHHAWGYDPDLVVLAFFTGNDVHNNSRALEHDPLKPYFVFEGDHLVLDDSFRDHPAFRARKTALARLSYRALDLSRTAEVVIHGQRNLRANLRHARQQRTQAGLEEGEELGLESAIYAEPEDPLWKEAWRVTEGILSMLHQEVREGGADLLVVTLSNSIQVHPDPGVRKRFEKSLAVPDLFYPERRIQALGAREGIPVLTLAPRLQAFAQRHQLHLHGFGADLGHGHWNQDGHRAAGTAIAELLCRDEDSPLPGALAKTRMPGT